MQNKERCTVYSNEHAYKQIIDIQKQFSSLSLFLFILNVFQIKKERELDDKK
jgi:hypothetical protein